MKKRKNTTTNIKKGLSKREKSKYPALQKGLNLSSRKDYIEPDYVKGVYDANGQMLIRPLTEDEMQFLNQYYEESVVTNFYHDPELRKLNKLKRSIIEDDTVKTMQKEVKRLRETDRKLHSRRIRELKEIIKITKKQNEETYSERLELIEEELQELREDKLLYPDTDDHKAFYNHNNSRNNCIFNKYRSMNQLMYLDNKQIDYALMQDIIQNADCEEDFIVNLESERDKVEKEEERLDKMLQEERTSKKKKKE
jgi:hypothetical protein